MGIQWVNIMRRFVAICVFTAVALALCGCSCARESRNDTNECAGGAGTRNGTCPDLPKNRHISRRYLLPYWAHQRPLGARSVLRGTAFLVWGHWDFIPVWSNSPPHVADTIEVPEFSLTPSAYIYDVFEQGNEIVVLGSDGRSVSYMLFDASSSIRRRLVLNCPCPISDVKRSHDQRFIALTVDRSTLFCGSLIVGQAPDLKKIFQDSDRQIEWAYPTSDDAAIVCLDTGTLQSVRNGQVLWSHNFQDSDGLSGAVCDAAPYLIAGTHDGSIVTINLASGGVSNSIRLPSGTATNLFVDPLGVAWVGTHSGEVFCYDKTFTTLLGTFKQGFLAEDLDAVVSIEPASIVGDVYVMRSSGVVTYVAARRYERKLSVALAGPSLASQTSNAELVVSANFRGEVLVWSRKERRVLRNLGLGGEDLVGIYPVGGSDCVFAFRGGDAVRIDVANSRVVWRRHVCEYLVAGCATLTGTGDLYFYGDSGELTLLEAGSGSKPVRIQLPVEFSHVDHCRVDSESIVISCGDLVCVGKLSEHRVEWSPVHRLEDKVTAIGDSPHDSPMLLATDDGRILEIRNGVRLIASLPDVMTGVGFADSHTIVAVGANGGYLLWRDGHSWRQREFSYQRIACMSRVNAASSLLLAGEYFGVAEVELVSSDRR